MPGSQETQEITGSCYRPEDSACFQQPPLTAEAGTRVPVCFQRACPLKWTLNGYVEDAARVSSEPRTDSTASPPPEELGCSGQMASLRSRRKGRVTRARRGSPILLAISQYLRSNHDPCLWESLAGREGARSGDNLTPRPQLFRLHSRRSPR